MEKPELFHYGQNLPKNPNDVIMFKLGANIYYAHKSEIDAHRAFEQSLEGQPQQVVPVNDNPTIQSLSQDPVVMSMTVLDFVNGKVIVAADSLLQTLILATLLDKQQKFTLVMSKSLFKRINLQDININGSFDYRVNSSIESDIVSVKFCKL